MRTMSIQMKAFRRMVQALFGVMPRSTMPGLLGRNRQKIGWKWYKKSLPREVYAPSAGKKDCVGRKNFFPAHAFFKVWYRRFYLVTLNQSASIQPRFPLVFLRSLTNPILAPIHLPWRMVKRSPASLKCLPSRL